jgi:UDP-N-acetylmuramoyl-L-alanyl-D-glutamate--2,6-diaminopimelate ligase
VSAVGLTSRGPVRPNWPLGELLAGFAVQPFESGARVMALTLDSREATPGSLFLACRGRGRHGLAYAEAAVERGAVAIVAEPDAAWGEAELGRLAGELALPVIPVPHLAQRAAEIAARFFGEPSGLLEAFGVTGTAGKTSVTHYLARALAADTGWPGLRCAVMGSLGHGFPDALGRADAAPALCTPDAVAMQRTLAQLAADGAEAVAIEVSSHALDQCRVGAVRFSHAVFTNLSRDHLDYHGDMAAYAAAKRRLFRMPGLRWAVLNADDPASEHMAAGLAPDVRVARYGQGAAAPPAADLSVWARQVNADAEGFLVDVDTSVGSGQFRAGLIGRFEVANLLAVLAVLLSREEPLDSALARLGTVQGLPGRMERFGGGDRPLAVVDGAHAPAALEQALTEVRGHCRVRLITVFGCGGGRDAGKRAAMGAVAERLADRVILTDDNPRFEDGARIIEDILAGMQRPDAVVVERQRAFAIRSALARAGRDDAVLVAGKGNETVQDMGELKVKFSDRAQVVQAQTEWEGRHP